MSSRKTQAQVTLRHQVGTESPSWEESTPGQPRIERGQHGATQPCSESQPAAGFGQRTGQPEVDRAHRKWLRRPSWMGSRSGVNCMVSSGEREVCVQVRVCECAPLC